MYVGAFSPMGVNLAKTQQHMHLNFLQAFFQSWRFYCIRMYIRIHSPSILDVNAIRKIRLIKTTIPT